MVKYKLKDIGDTIDYAFIKNGERDIRKIDYLLETYGNEFKTKQEFVAWLDQFYKDGVSKGYGRLCYRLVCNYGSMMEIAMRTHYGAEYKTLKDKFIKIHYGDILQFMIAKISTQEL